MTNHPDIPAYIATFPTPIQEILENLRSALKIAAPDATEAIKYGMPTLVFHGNLVYFGAFKKHIGFYPMPSGVMAFKEELSKYKLSKGAIQFPIHEPLPFEIIQKITQFRVQENLDKAALKKQSK